MTAAIHTLHHPTLTLDVQGMTCASCVRRVERALSAVPGVEAATVNLATGQAQVRLATAAKASSGPLQAALQATLKQAGYEASLVDDQLEATPPTAAVPGWQAAVALALSAPLVAPMVLGWFDVALSVPAWLQWLLSTLVLGGLGARFFVGAFKALRHGTATMDVLVALGTAAAWGLSLWLWRQNPGIDPHELYFESAAVVVSLVLLGQWLEGRAKRRAWAALTALQDLRPATVVLKRDGVIRKAPLAELAVGDVMLVAPGERVAADGTVLAGSSHVQEAMLTGEPLPAFKDIGSTVAAGGLNGEGQMDVRVTAVGAQTSLGRIAKLVTSAQATKAPVQQKVDRVAAVFVPAVVGLAFLTLLAWKWFGASTAQAVMHAVTVLVIACPCALGLATPMALMVGMGRAAQRGILVRDAQALELLGQVHTVAFDKTGTLTRGQPALVAVNTASPAIDAAGLLGAAAALQAGSKHPLALAVMQAATASLAAPTTASAAAPIADSANTIPVATDVQAVPGRGVSGTVQGVHMLLGSQRWLDELHVATGSLAALAKTYADQGHAIAWLAMVQGPPQVGTSGAAQSMPSGEQVQVLGLMAFHDEVRPEAAATMRHLHTMGVSSVLISGDHPAAVANLAKAVGITQVHAQILPGDKARIVNELRRTLPAGRTVAMVGDGINDAPALAAADVGIALASGTDIAMEAAGLTLMHSDVSRLPQAILLSRAVTAKVKQNLFWAFAYNVVGLGLAAAGMLNPMVAGAAMAFSSLSVVLNALLLRVPDQRNLDWGTTAKSLGSDAR
jgi:P-type Cu+ transporter